VRQLRFHALAISFYALLAFIILHAIVFTTGVRAAGFDWFNYNWNFWWIRHALSTGVDVYSTDFVFAPHVNNLGYHALTAVWFPVWALLEPFVGTLTAMNVILFLMCFLNGYVLFGLLRREGVQPGLALLGGVILQMSPVARYFYYNTHINLGDWFWLPLHVLLWGNLARAVAEARWGRVIGWALLQGIALWGTGHTDLQFPIFVAFWLVPYGMWTLAVTPGGFRFDWAAWRYRLRLIGAGLVVIGVAGALLWFLGPLRAMSQFEGELAPGTVEDRPGIPFPRGYFSVDTVWWYWQTPTLGATVIVLLLVTLGVLVWRWRKVRTTAAPAKPLNFLHPPVWFWLSGVIPAFILTLGPTLTLFGQSIPLPFRLLHILTNGNFRMPWRLAPIYIASAVLFVGLLWSRWLRGWRKERVVLVLVMVFLLAAWDIRLYETAPLEPVLPAYHFYSRIGQERGPTYDRLVLLEVPTGVGTGETLIGEPNPIQFQYYGMTHGKRMVNGFISRAPVEHFWPVRTDDPLLAWLGQRRFLEPDVVEAQLRRIIPEWPLGYIVLHQDDIGRNGPTPQEIIGFLNQLDDLVCPLWVERDAVVYRTYLHPDGCPPRTPPEVEPAVYEIDIGSSGDERFIGWGWHWLEQISPETNWRWMGEYAETQVYLDLPPGDYELSLAAQAFWEARTLQVWVNETRLDPTEAVVQPDGLQMLRWRLPAAVVGAGDHLTVTLRYDAVVVPAEIGQSADPRRLALAVDWLRWARVTP
jgi:hypothetical protein